MNNKFNINNSAFSNFSKAIVLSSLVLMPALAVAQKNVKSKSKSPELSAQELKVRAQKRIGRALVDTLGSLKERKKDQFDSLINSSETRGQVKAAIQNLAPDAEESVDSGLSDEAKRNTLRNKLEYATDNLYRKISKSIPDRKVRTLAKYCENAFYSFMKLAQNPDVNLSFAPEQFSLLLSSEVSNKDEMNMARQCLSMAYSNADKVSGYIYHSSIMSSASNIEKALKNRALSLIHVLGEIERASDNAKAEAKASPAAWPTKEAEIAGSVSGVR